MYSMIELNNGPTQHSNTQPLAYQTDALLNMLEMCEAQVDCDMHKQRQKKNN